MSTPERNRPHLELSTNALVATNPAEFAQLLNHIRMRAGLSPSQISIKTKIPRSQAYALIKHDRTTMPSKPEQVKAFLNACNLTPLQSAMVMDLWRRLSRPLADDDDLKDRSDDERRRWRRGYGAPITIDPFNNGDGYGPDRSDLGLPTVRPTHWNIPVPGGQEPGERELSGLRRRRRAARAGTRRSAATELLFLIVNDRDRTHRALLLLLPVAAAIISIVALLVTLAILRPEIDGSLALGAVGIGLLILGIVRVLMGSRWP